MTGFHFNKDFWFEGRLYILLLLLFLAMLEPYAGVDAPNLIYFVFVVLLLLLQFLFQIYIIGLTQLVATISIGSSIKIRKSTLLSF
ncbi:hypothetical protein SGODD07_01970 [Streptococcus gordonii]|uniref:Uncharacterized protein n=1 Tax=Streptococcus gordonii TaxID=1302 RepID=A0A139MYR1_STRGN|nr:hypothetical protein SGODD07_01970 [Streptococcus gordonii]